MGRETRVRNQRNRFIESCVPAKVGTMPMMIRLDGRCKIAIGNKVRWREHDGQRKWETGIVDCIDPLRISRM